jgi:hypothetical protein
MIDSGGLRVQIWSGRYAHNNAARLKSLHSRIRTVNGNKAENLCLKARSDPKHTSEGWIRLD